MGPLQLLFGLINFLICLGGVVLVAISSWLLIEPESFTNFIDVTISQINGENATVPQEFTDFLGQVNNALWLSLVGAIILLLVGFLGCCGAFRKNACMLNSYAFIMIVSILLQIASAVVVFWYSSDITNVVVAVLEQYNPDADSIDSSFNEFIDNVQQNQQCCGWSSEQDYKANTFLNPSNNATFSLPDSCCGGNNTTGCTTASGDLVTVGCSSTLRGMGWTLGGIILGFVLIELLATIAACYIKKKDKNFA